MTTQTNGTVESQVEEPKQAKTAKKVAPAKTSAKTKKSTTTPAVTLGELAERFLEHLELGYLIDLSAVIALGALRRTEPRLGP